MGTISRGHEKTRNQRFLFWCSRRRILGRRPHPSQSRHFFHSLQQTSQQNRHHRLSWQHDVANSYAYGRSLTRRIFGFKEEKGTRRQDEQLPNSSLHSCKSNKRRYFRKVFLVQNGLPLEL